MSRKVAVHVHVAGRAFAPGDVMPEEFAAKVKNPAVWAAADDVPLDEGGELPSGEVATTNGTGGPEQVSPEPPPRSGKGSGRDAWAAYAAMLGVTVTVETTRDELIAKLEERGMIAPAE